MRARHITKILIVTSLGTIAFVPTLLLASCASISQWNLPIVIGSSNSPWSDFNDFDTYGKDLDPSYLATRKPDNPDIFFDPNKTNYFSPSSSYDYLPSSYISFTDPQSGISNYEFAQAYNDVNWNKTDENANLSQLYDYDWLSNLSTKLKYSESLSAKKADGTTPSDKSNEVNVLTSARNLNLTSSLNYAPAVGLTINNWTNSLLSFITQDGVLNNKSEANEKDWYSKIFTNDEGNDFVPPYQQHGDNTVRNNFYQFMLDQCNLLSHGKVAAKFATSASDYKFTSETYGPGPLINNAAAASKFGLEKSYVGGDALKTKILSVDGKTLLPSFVTESEAPSNIAMPNATCITYSSLSKDYDAHTDGQGPNTSSRDLFLPDGGSFILPFLVTPTETQYSYFNPLKKHTFQQNDYLIKDKNIVEKAIQKSWQPSWQQHTKSSLPEDSQLSLSWKMNQNNTNAGAWGRNTFYLNTPPEDMFTEIDNSITDNNKKASYVDPSMYLTLKTPSDSNRTLLPNTYIGFATYQVIPMLHESQYYNDASYTWSQYDKSPYHYSYDYMPFCTGLYSPDGSTPGVFPLALLYNRPLANAAPTLDTSLFHSTLLPEANYLLNGYVDSDGNPLVPEIKSDKDGFKNNPMNKMYTFDFSAIIKKQNDIFKFMSKRLGPNSKPSDFDSDDAKNAFWIWQALFGSWNVNYTLNGALNSNKVFIPDN